MEDENDLLDDRDFDPIAYINKFFPDEESLDNLDTFVVGIDAQIDTIDEEISKAVQTQSGLGHEASKDISEAQTAIIELYDKIQNIKAKAAQSEKMVQEICAEIKQLDYAKNHLQSSITALKRLQMLITAVNQLELLARDFQYREVANLLDAVKQLMAHFEKYTNIPMIADIKTRIDLIQSDLQKHVRKAFREIGQLADSVADMDVLLQSLPGNMKSLSDACLVVDALGAEARKEMLEEFVQLQLVPYEKLFGIDQEHYNLESVDRRWAWFKRLLKQVRPLSSFHLYAYIRTARRVFTTLLYIYI
jgi:DNA repair exonuclease SbcCD ATPase subunit